MDKGTDAEGEEGDGKKGGGGLGVDGGGTFRGAGEGRGELEEGAGGAEEGEKGDEQGAVHDVFAEVFLLAEEAEHEEDDSEVAGDQGGWMDRAGQKKGGQSQQQVGQGKKNGDFWHGIVTSRPNVSGK